MSRTLAQQCDLADVYASYVVLAIATTDELVAFVAGRSTP